MALIYLISSVLLGTALVRRLKLALYPFEVVAASTVLGIFLWTWAAFVVSLVLPFDTGLPIVVVASLALTLALWPGGSIERRPLEGGRVAWGVWGVASAITAIPIGILLWSHSMVVEDGAVWSAGAAWADYGLHTAIITHIAANPSLPMDLPIASGVEMTYPFLIDLQSALLVVGGMSLHASLFWPGLLLSVAICQLLIAVGLRLFGRISVGVGGMLLALTWGSAAGAWVAWSDWRESGKGLFAFLGALPQDYTQLDDPNAHVTNLLVDGLIPQRAILFGLAVGLVALILMIAARQQRRTALLWPAAGLVGLLPMAHPHSFLIGVGLLAWFAVVAAWKDRAVPKAELKPLALAVLIALPQLAWQQLANGTGTGGRFRLGWMVADGENILGYWWVNFGLLGLAALAVPLAMRRDRRVFWVLPMLIVLLITQLYAFQPFEYDNLKLIWWAFIVVGFFAVYLAFELVRRSKAWLLAVVPVAAITMLPGVLAIVHEFQLRYQFAGPADLELVDWVEKNTPTEAVFATSDAPTMPVASLAGRRIVSGYTGWVYNFNVPYAERQDAVRAGFQGDFENVGLRRYGATYLLVPKAEDPSWPLNEAALAQRQPAWQNQAWRVYQLQ